MSNTNYNVIFAGSGESVGLAFTIEPDIKGIQTRFVIESEDETFLMGILPYLNNLLAQITWRELEEGFNLYQNQRPMLDAKWEDVLYSNDGRIPLKVWLEPEGKVLGKNQVALVVETTNDRYSWVGEYVTWSLKPYLQKLLSYSASVMKSRKAVRQAMLESSDRQYIDLTKLFLRKVEGAHTIQEIELMSLMFRVISPLDPSPMAMRVIREGYSGALAAWPNISANAKPLSEASIEENIGRLLNLCAIRHLNLYVNEEDDAEVEDAFIMRYTDLILSREMPLNIVVNGGNQVERALAWLDRMENLVGSEENSFGLKLLEKQFAVTLTVESSSEIESFSKALIDAGWCLDGISFMCTEKVFTECAVTLTEHKSYKTTEWDQNYFDTSDMKLVFDEVSQDQGDIQEAISFVIDHFDKTMPHIEYHDEVSRGHYSGWWLKAVVYKKPAY
ncbi:hypothetical protein ABXV18_24375 [Vibrio owensii]|uniref:hypothetical protein n=1 Tax=Vibrio owensii TaxID=696485 RepID=UPI003396EBD6